ncbi:putative cell wall glucanase [Talaromyces proteolyticus]|uniref:glucan endo-1,3-beta-D-glucosidase n=1 Tax=Talaromyces proteolyticus TaxID=1131652 RepID=A0AAD4KY81_9EURO|nr:putative cell wall glucanase [Talaromyces proteolyticus]KAH8701732.1 putative cell wall glucanase [Talaromyces proteolyticus]
MSRRPHSPSSHDQVSPIDSNVPSASSQISPVSEHSMSRNFPSAAHPAAHPDSAYGRLSSQRFGNIDAMNRPPSPPQHRSQQQDAPAPQITHSNSLRTNASATPGMDNLGAAAPGGGISGIAFGVASRNERQSGLEAMRSIDEREQHYYDGPSDRNHIDTRYIPPPGPYSDQPTGPSTADQGARYSYPSNSSLPLGGAAPLAASFTPSRGTPSLAPSNPSQLSVGEPYPRYPSGGLYDGPYSSYNGHDPASINPDEIADDGDDGFIQVPQRRSGLFGKKSSQEAVAGAAGGAAAGGVLGAMNNLRGGGSTAYGPVPGGEAAAQRGEKNPYLDEQVAAASKKRKRWLMTLLVGFIIIAVIVGAIVGGILGSRKNNASTSNSGSDSSGDGSDDPGTNINTATGDIATNGDLDKNSPEIKKLLNNDNLHRVFYGMDYTSWGVQYPLCLEYPPSPNNVTRDMAILSQLTNTVRVYGTDCNQTQMVLHSIDRLGLTDMKLWLGVWVDSNETTVNRQIDILYDVIDGMNNTSIIEGVIVGNEVLYSGGFSDQSTAQQKLTSYMESVRSNLTSKGLKIPVATSDLGNNWNADLLAASDLVMANVHPFFGGVQVDKAAAWTATFFDQHDVSLISGTSKSAIISEVGWPSGGGNDSGSVAGIDEMNQFMSDWVCQALNNGTKYFWFEAFDEPWKVKYNTPGKEWEDKWGLLDSGRNLKSGLTIPDCGGKTV